jgi:hypothetical protein
MRVLNLLDLSTEAQNLDDHWVKELKKKLQQNKERDPAVSPDQASASKELPNGLQETSPPKLSSLGLARLVAKFLSLNLVKSKKVVMSNWETVPLTEQQQQCEPCSDMNTA